MPARHCAAALLLSVTVWAAHAQAIYRCGDSYSQQPCAGGQQLASPPPAPSPADRAQAGANTRRDAEMAASLERDRLRQESRAPATPLYLPPPPAESGLDDQRRWPEQKATRKLDLFTAHVPGSGKKKHDKEKSKGKGASATKAAAAKSKATAAKASTGPGPRELQVAKPAKAGRAT